MNKIYQDWIKENVINPNLQYAKYTKNMKKALPELQRVRGHYECPLIGRRPHWWLKDEDGSIVDPTVAQFMPCGLYDEWDESQPEPTRKCMNYGDLCYEGRSVCSDECEKELIKYMDGV